MLLACTETANKDTFDTFSMTFFHQFLNILISILKYYHSNSLVELELDCVHIVPKLNGCLRKLSRLKELKIMPVPTDFIPEWKTSFTVEVCTQQGMYG